MTYRTLSGRPPSYSNEWLKEYIENNGMSRALEKLESDKVEDEYTRELLEELQELWEELCGLEGEFMEHLGCE